MQLQHFGCFSGFKLLGIFLLLSDYLYGPNNSKPCWVLRWWWPYKNVIKVKRKILGLRCITGTCVSGPVIVVDLHTHCLGPVSVPRVITAEDMTLSMVVSLKRIWIVKKKTRKKRGGNISWPIFCDTGTNPGVKWASKNYHLMFASKKGGGRNWPVVSRKRVSKKEMNKKRKKICVSRPIHLRR